MTGAAQPIVIPVGRLLGTFYSQSESMAHRITLRLGTALHELTDDEFTTWWLAHGVPEPSERPWTAIAIAETAAELDLPEAGPLLDRLRTRGLVEDVRRATPEVIDFAARYRIVPRLLGLGNTPEEPWFFQIGLFGQPVIGLPGALYELWRWAGIDDHLWDGCRAAATIASQGGVSDPDQTDPELLLDAFLELLHPLLGAQAMHLDLRRGARRAHQREVPDGG